MNVEFTPLIEMELAEIRQLPATPTTLVALLNRASHLKTLDPIRAFAIAAEAMQRAHHLNEPQQEARARAISAYAAAQVEQDEISHLYGEQALTEGSRWDDYITMGYACLGIGQYLINQFRYDDALEIGLHGYDLLGLAGDHAAQANITFIVMGAYSRLGNREQAEAYTFRAIEQYQELQNVGGESVQLNNLAMHFFWMGEYDRARQYGDQAVALFRQAQQQGQPFDFAFVQPGIMHTLAEIAIAQNDLVGAEQFLQEGLTYVRTSTNAFSPNDETFLLLALGKFKERLGDLQEARCLLITALWRARRDHHRLLIAEVAQELMEVYQALGNYRRALWYSNFYHSIDKTRYHEQLVSKMRHLEITYQMKATRREIEALAQQNRQLERAYADLQAAHHQIQELSIRDGLTHLYNRQYFEEWATAALAQCQQNGEPFALLLTDIDNFKRINDTWLHHTGDRVIQAVAAQLQAHCPARGKTARYGGEEFVLAVPDCTLAQLYTLAEQFRASVEQYLWHEVHPEISVTVSCGIMESMAGESLTHQLIQADLNLYMAKRNGKNRVEGNESLLVPPHASVDSH